MARAWGMLVWWQLRSDYGLLLCLQEERKMATFTQYALAAAREALEDAEWDPKSEDELDATVSALNLNQDSSTA